MGVTQQHVEPTRRLAGLRMAESVPITSTETPQAAMHPRETRLLRIATAL
jgi:hypothetical protein